MQIHASSLGEAVPSDSFDAVIHSAFESAVNMRLAGEDRLTTVLISDRYELPQGIRITTKDAPLQKLEPGRCAACKGGILRFDSSPLSIDLRGAPVWKCRIAGLTMDMQSHGVQQAWSAAWDLLNRHQKRENSDIIADELFRLQVRSQLGQRISRPVMQLLVSTDGFDVHHSILAAEGIIGLGPGATPSGDDILIGFLAGLWSLSGQHVRRQSFIRSFGRGLLKIARRTNEISRTYLYHAVQGQFSSTLSTLVENIRTGQGVEQAVQDAMRVGHSSGMDSVTGLLISLAVWNEPALLNPIKE
jgi:hypothetical protein